MLQKFNVKNKDLLVYVNGELIHRDQPHVSAFDSAVQGGDAVWEGLRLYTEGVFCFRAHYNRMYESAKACGFEKIPNFEEVKNAVKQTVQANGMTDDTHIRLTLSRGVKITSGMDPRLNQNGPVLIVLAEWKPLVYDNKNGIKVITSAIRRNNPAFLDSKIHHANLLNNILAKIQANYAQVDAAIMLDKNGFVAELNDTNLFMVKNNVLFTPHADACLHGITRGLVLKLAKNISIPIVERNLSVTEFYSADEVFATGTMGELTPIFEIDGRKIENKRKSNVRQQISKEFKQSIPGLCEQL